MVMRTCCRLLGSLPDAEDCFQATFLVLCRKARTIARQHSLGSWLHKVAYRICMRARAARRRQPRELPAGIEPTAGESVLPLATQEERAVLVEELNWLPDKYRAPLVLHYLENKTVEQTAAELGWPYGTVCVRLTRGKDRLRVRLARRGLTLSAGVVAASLAQEEAAAAIGPSVARATIQAALGLAPGMGPASPSVRTVELADALIRAETRRRIGWMFALVLVVGTATGAGVALTHDHQELRPEVKGIAAEANAETEQPAGVDRDGDPLPRGAILRIGSAHFRQGDLLRAAAYSPDGQTLTTIGSLGLIRTWDARTGKPHETFLGASLNAPREPVNVVSANGRFAAGYELPSARSLADGRITLWGLADGSIRKSLAVPENYEILALAVSNDGSRLAASRASQVDPLLVWDVPTGKPPRCLPAAGWGGQPSFLRIALSPHGKLVAGFDSHPTIRLWDVESSEERRPLSMEGAQFSALAFSGDGLRLACGDLAGRISVWETRSGQLVRSFSARRSQPATTATRSSDPGSRPSPVMGRTQKRRGPLMGLDGVTSLALSFDGSSVACCCDETLCLWNVETGHERGQFDPVDFRGSRQIALAFSSDGKRLAGGDSSAQVKVWDVATGRRILFTDEPDLSSHDNDAQCYATISPDGATAATFRSGLVGFWDVRTGQVTGTIGAANVDGRSSQPITFSADGRFLLRPYHWVRVSDVVSGRADWNLEWALYPLPRIPEAMPVKGRDLGVQCNDFRLVRQVATGSLPALAGSGQRHRPFALSPNGKIVAWECGDGPVDAARNMILLCEWTGRETGRILCPGTCQSASFAPDGQSIAVAGESYVGTWNATSGQEIWKSRNELWNLKTIGAHRPLAFSPDGTLLATGDENCNICLWDAATGQVAHILKGHGGPITSLVFSSDGRRLISGSADTTALIWDVASIAADRRRSAAKERHRD
jgi:RNA polymerase sigma factor (sigma-70 family)